MPEVTSVHFPVLPTNFPCTEVCRKFVGSVLGKNASEMHTECENNEAGNTGHFMLTGGGPSDRSRLYLPNSVRMYLTSSTRITSNKFSSCNGVSYDEFTPSEGW